MSSEQTPNEGSRAMLCSTAFALLREVYDQAGNSAPPQRRHALTPALRDRIRDFIYSDNAEVRLADADYVLQWCYQADVPGNIHDLSARAIDEPSLAHGMADD